MVRKGKNVLRVKKKKLTPILTPLTVNVKGKGEGDVPPIRYKLLQTIKPTPQRTSPLRKPTINNPKLSLTKK